MEKTHYVRNHYHQESEMNGRQQLASDFIIWEFCQIAISEVCDEDGRKERRGKTKDCKKKEISGRTAIVTTSQANDFY
jgi:hypothetical protein